MTNRYIEQVTRGAAWLDENQPGWERRVDLSILSLEDTCQCVLGQVFEAQAAAAFARDEWWRHAGWNNMHFGFRYVVEVLKVGGEGSWEWAVEHGFNLSENDQISAANNANWRELEEAWFDLIKLRFDTGTFSDQ